MISPRASALPKNLRFIGKCMTKINDSFFTENYVVLQENNRLMVWTDNPLKDCLEEFKQDKNNFT